MAERAVRTVRPRTYRVLTLMRDRELASGAEFALTHGTYLVRHIRSASELPATLRDWDPDLAFVDLDVESGAALDLLCRPGLPRRATCY